MFKGSYVALDNTYSLHKLLLTCVCSDTTPVLGGTLAAAVVDPRSLVSCMLCCGYVCRAEVGTTLGVPNVYGGGSSRVNLHTSRHTSLRVNI